MSWTPSLGLHFTWPKTADLDLKNLSDDSLAEIGVELTRVGAAPVVFGKNTGNQVISNFQMATWTGLRGAETAKLCHTATGPGG